MIFSTWSSASHPKTGPRSGHDGLAAWCAQPDIPSSASRSLPQWHISISSGPVGMVSIAKQLSERGLRRPEAGAGMYRQWQTYSPARTSSNNLGRTPAGAFYTRKFLEAATWHTPGCGLPTPLVAYPWLLAAGA